ncbi:endolytic transglycosylase MltG [Bavariicoccus seileri]|uniref:endolytic transglycosylase MltG n=1 Tax=Bavariicoccus seileri TaxID=549685 RepID=UPI003F911D90
MKPREKKAYKERLKAKRYERDKEQSIARKIVWVIVTILLTLMLIVGVIGYRYVNDALLPVSNDTKTEEIEIPLGTSTSGIANILEENHIIKDARIFSIYLKFQNASEFRAGYYELSPSMTLDQIILTLEKGGSDSSSAEKVLVREGDTVDQIGDEVADKTSFTKDDFMKAVDDDALFDELLKEYPDLLTDVSKTENVMHRLEGYLFPATYDYSDSSDIKDLIKQMVAKTNEVMTPYLPKIMQSEYNVQQILTIASLVEREGVTEEDRQKIAGVFYNRLNTDMMIQSDISVLYALGEHKEYVTIKDTQVNSPYNLYLHTGLGPGPFGNPSEQAIAATLNPIDSNYYYFVADISTGKVYFAETYEEHLKLQEEYVKDPNES